MVIRTQSDFNYFLFMNMMNNLHTIISKKQTALLHKTSCAADLIPGERVLKYSTVKQELENIAQELLDPICNIVENDFCVDMETLTPQGMREYTQEEAKEMAKLLGKVYSYAHQIHCNAHINERSN